MCTNRLCVENFIFKIFTSGEENVRILSISLHQIHPRGISIVRVHTEITERVPIEELDGADTCSKFDMIFKWAIKAFRCIHIHGVKG